MPELYLLRSALRDLIRPKRLVTAGFLVVLPGIIASLWRLAAGDQFQPTTAYNVMAGSLVFGFTLVILAVLFGSGVVSQEIEQRTIVYLLSRPVPRARILLAKFIGAVVGIIATTWLATLVLAFATSGLGAFQNERLGQDLLVLVVGALAYGSLALLFATVFRWPLLPGLMFAFGWESWVSLLPGKFPYLSLMAYLRVLAPHPQTGPASNDLGELLQLLNPTQIAPLTARIVLALVIIGCLSLSMLVFTFKEYAPREDST